ncbi:MAG: hypothetical protein ACE15F_20640 [bacterium]
MKDCIICGRPSETVVCMRCFFQYNPQMYNARGDDYYTGTTAPAPVRETPQASVPWNNEIQTGAQSEPVKHPTPPERPPVKNPVVSWFSRLPRF